MGDIEKKQNKRRNRRVRVGIPIETRIVDISESGISVATDLIPKKGTFITVTIDGMQFTAIVRHEFGGKGSDFSGFGAEFQMLTADHYEKIRKIMIRVPVEKEARKIASKETELSIILVDGDSISRMIYGNRLNKGGFHVITLSSFDDAQEMLQRGSVAAVVCDYTSDTLKAIEMIRKNHAELAICVLSRRSDVPLELLQKLDVTYKSKALTSPEMFFNYIDMLVR